MSLDRRIADSFAFARPKEAARLVETMELQHVKELLDGCDSGAAAAVIGAMTPSAATRYLMGAAPSTAAPILEGLPLDRVADLMRRLDTGARDAFLGELAEERRRALERVLRYPEDTAGSLMEPRVAAFHEDATVHEVLGRVRELGEELRYYLYVIDDNNKLSGVVSLPELASKEPDGSLRSIMTRPVQSLSARAGRRAILEHPGWALLPLLPVVDETGVLVGVFRYETLRHLEEHASEGEEPSPLGVALALGELFWLGASGLFRGMEPSARAESERSESRSESRGGGAPRPLKEEPSARAESERSESRSERQTSDEEKNHG